MWTHGVVNVLSGEWGLGWGLGWALPSGRLSTLLQGPSNLTPTSLFSHCEPQLQFQLPKAPFSSLLKCRMPRTSDS